MDEWIDRMAEALGEEPVAPTELGEVLKLAREVAHRVERKLAPVSTFLAGVYAGRQVAGGGSRPEALARAAASAHRLRPEPAGDDPGPPDHD